MKLEEYDRKRVVRVLRMQAAIIAMNRSRYLCPSAHTAVDLVCWWWLPRWRHEFGQAVIAAFEALVGDKFGDGCSRNLPSPWRQPLEAKLVRLEAIWRLIDKVEARPK